jgi:hypothetical protein
MDEQIPRYSHLLDEETGELHRSTTPGVCVYHFGTVWPFGIGSKPSACNEAAVMNQAAGASL